MAQNSRSEMAPPPTAAQEQQDFTQSTSSNGKIQIKRTAEIQSDQPVTVTTTTSHGNASDFIPTLIPALQSGAYVLVILAGFVAWSSRKLAIDFMTKHISLVESLEQNLDVQLETAKTQMSVLQQMTTNNQELIKTNEKLGYTISNIAERNSSQMGREAVHRETVRDSEALKEPNN